MKPQIYPKHIGEHNYGSEGVIELQYNSSPLRVWDLKS